MGGGDAGSGSGGSGGGPDVGAILAYLNHWSFGTDGDYTGNAGYSGDNTGPPGSKAPQVDPDVAAALNVALVQPPRGERGRPPPSQAARGERSGTIDPYGGIPWAGRGLFAFVGGEVDVFSGLPLGIDTPDSFTGFPASDPFVDEWPARVRNVTAPFAALRPTNLLSSPNLLADNDVTACNPNRTSCLPELKSDANQSSLATVIQAEMDESYVAIQALSEGRAKIIGNGEVDMQKLASTAVQVANSDEYKLGFAVNQLRDHPLEIRHSAVFTGLGHVVAGTVVATASGFVIYGTGGLALPLGGAMGFAAGVAEAGSGLALAFSGADSIETVRMSGQLDYVFALTSSPASLVFGTTGLVLSGGDVNISHRFALAGGIAEGMAGFRGDPSKLYSSLLPGVGTKAEKGATTLLVKEVAALGHEARSASIGQELRAGNSIGDGKRRLELLPGQHFVPNKSVAEAFQGFTTRVASKLEASPSRTASYLTPSQNKFAAYGPWAEKIVFGNAVENAMARAAGPVGFLDHTGNIRPFKLGGADFEGVRGTPWAGYYFQVTTEKQWYKHWMNDAPGTIYGTYR
ncbi:MAG: hypothetical protein EOS11_02095 [Mesorhizobium sp.]|uniref:hypothetical protein n=1 Tax=Mesorhizobium sp. TaxID=1871066 RepID=UPI000FE3CFEB|nr:hypothetical protein [Mesorhizobium sp.]RWO50943.1 MAG: hypothetical protein EOS11_02095 [Mesorhizobium sp.]TIN79328.1 MAG: hypothetical protein E5Y09_07810 [Mesorhizobium sp.]